MPRIFDLVEFMDPTGQEMVHRIPEQGSGDFRLGSQLVVRESQAAVFFRDGQALDTFGPGRHTLTTANIPLLTGLIALPFGGRSPFRAEVYFVNLREFLDQKWGTPEAIAFRDADLGMVRLRAFGTYSMQVADPQLFVNKIVGTQALYYNTDIQDFLRSIVIAKMMDLLGELRKSLFDFPQLYEEIGAGTRAKVRDDFSVLGIDMKSLYVNSISPTEETQAAIDERASMGAIGNMQAYLQFKAAQALGGAAQAPGEGAAPGMAQAGMGLGAGMGMGAIMAQMMAQMTQQGAGAATRLCPSCSATIPASAKFCPKCGAKIGGGVICPNCKADVPEGAKFCPNCGAKMG